MESKFKLNLSEDEENNLIHISKGNDLKLFLACYDNDFLLVNTLLTIGVNKEILDVNGHTPLLISCFKNNFDCVKTLLNWDVNIEATGDFEDGKNHFTGLLLVCELGYTSIAKLLLEKNANMEVVDNRYNETPLIKSIIFSHNNIVKLLLDKGADIKAINVYGTNSLYNALDYVNYTAVEYILEKDNTLIKDFPCILVLLTAELFDENNGGFDMVKTLLEYGCEIDTLHEDYFKSTELDIACQYGYFRCVELLLEYDANMENNEDRDSVLLNMCNADTYTDDTLKCFELLINRGANLEIVVDSYTPLLSACLNRYDKYLTMLVKSGAKINAVDSDGNSVLHIFIKIYESQYTDDDKIMVDFFLQHGVNLEGVNNDGATPLLFACRYNWNCNLVNLLLMKGANVNAVDTEENSAIDYIEQVLSIEDDGNDGIATIIIEKEIIISLFDFEIDETLKNVSYY